MSQSSSRESIGKRTTKCQMMKDTTESTTDGSRHTDKNENDVILNPRLTSQENIDEIAIQLGRSFHVTTLAKLPSIVKYGLLPGGDKGTRGSSFFNHYAPWGVRASTVLRSKAPTDDVPIVLYVPIAYLQRLAESSYVVVFQGVPWECIKSAWYKEPVQGKWRRLLAKGVVREPPDSGIKVLKQDSNKGSGCREGKASYCRMHKER